MLLHRDREMTRKSAWHITRRLRKALDDDGVDLPFEFSVEADETYVGGKENNRRARKKLKAGRGTVGKTAVAGIRDCASGQVVAKVVERTGAGSLPGLVTDHSAHDATARTDCASSCKGIDRNHATARRSVGEYVQDQAHAKGHERDWAPLKRGFVGVCHRMSPKHLGRRVNEFSVGQNARDRDTIDQMSGAALQIESKRLMRNDFIAADGLNSGARS